jgi:hypothetical protein
MCPSRGATTTSCPPTTRCSLHVTNMTAWLACHITYQFLPHMLPSRLRLACTCCKHAEYGCQLLQDLEGTQFVPQTLHGMAAMVRTFDGDVDTGMRTCCCPRMTDQPSLLSEFRWMGLGMPDYDASRLT